MTSMNHPTDSFLSGIPFRFIPFLIPYLSHQQCLDFGEPSIQLAHAGPQAIRPILGQQ